MAPLTTWALAEELAMHSVWHAVPETVPRRQAHEDRPREEQAVPMHPVSESFFVSYFSVHKYEHLTIKKKEFSLIKN